MSTAENSELGKDFVTAEQTDDDELKEIWTAIDSSDIESLKHHLPLRKRMESEGGSLLKRALLRRPFIRETVDELLLHVCPYTTDVYLCPLHAAVCLGEPDDQLHVLRLLIKSGANTSLCDQAGRNIITKFLINYRKRHLATVLKLLKSSGCSINHLDINGNTPLQAFLHQWIAASNRCTTEESAEIHTLEVITECIKQGSDIKTVNIHGETLLHTAVRRMNHKVCQILIQAGVDGNANTTLGGNAAFELLIADSMRRSSEPAYTTREYEAMIKVLQDGGVDINKADQDGCHVIQHAVQLFVPTYVPCLIEALTNRGASLECKDKLGNNIHHYACRNPYYDEIQHTVKDISGVNDRNIFQLTPLQTACLYKDIIPLTSIIKIGGKTDMKGSFDTNLLHLYVSYTACAEDMLEELLSTMSLPDVNARDSSGCTPLHYAAFNGDNSAITFLMENGADASLKNKSGLTALEYAEKHGKYKCYNTLREARESSSQGDQVLQGLTTLLTTTHINCLPSYTTEITTYLSMQRRLGQDADSIMRSLGINRVKHDEPSIRLISNTVERFFSNVIRIVGDMDWRFTGVIIPSGSSYEGTKVGRPDEFDFMVNLVRISEMIECEERTADGGFVELKVKQSSIKDNSYFSKYITDDGYIDSVTLQSDYNILIRRAIVQAYSEQEDTDTPGHMIREAQHISTPDVNPVEVNRLVSHSFIWVCDEYKFMPVSVDINLVLYSDNWSHDLLQTSALVKPNDLRQFGVFYIPKYLIYKENFYETDYKRWRVSFSHVETKIFEQVGEFYQKCFALIKSLRLPPLCPAIQYGKTHVSLKKLQEFNNNQPAADEETSEESSNQTADGNTESPSRNHSLGDMLAAFKSAMEAKQKNNKKTSYKAALMESSGEAGDDNCSEISDGLLSLASSCTESSYNTVTGAEIPQTYHLKQAFFTVTEKLVGKEINTQQINAVEVASQVYRLLLESIKAEDVRSYLNPTQNLYRRQMNPFISEGEKMTPNDEKLIQMKMCEHILAILETLTD